MRKWKDKEISLNDDNTKIIVKESKPATNCCCGQCTITNIMPFDKQMVKEAFNSYAGPMFKDMFGNLVTQLK